MLDAIVERLRKGEVNLPTYPKISAKLAELMCDQAGITQVARLLEEDAVVSAKLIGISNSARYRRHKPNQNVEQAISMLGLPVTQNHVELIANRSLFASANSHYEKALQTLWEHSAACAHGARAIAKLADLEEPDDVFSMGVLHDIGKLLLIRVIAEMESRGEIEDDDQSSPEIQAFLHKQHGFFGGKLLEIWKLPKAHAEAAQYHDAVDSAPTVSKELLAVHLGNLIAKKAGYGTFDAAVWEARAARDAARLQLTLQDLAAVEKDVLAIMKDTETG